MKATRTKSLLAAVLAGASIGRFDKGLEEAKARGWTVVSMKDDWKTIFPPEKK